MLRKIRNIWIVSLCVTLILSGLFVSSCKPSKQPDVIGQDSTGTDITTVKVTNAYPNLTFASPVEYTHANDGSNRVFVVEQAGMIRVFENDGNASSAGVYLDIRSKVASSGEMGLLGLAFHPDFKQNGFLYVNYTKNNPLETIVSRFKAASADAMSVDSATEVILLRFGQPYTNHNGGKILFGPDGYLYVASGDGGSGGDPQNNAQNLTSWLGKILRVDVNSTEKGQYGIPADNPYKGNSDGYREEIFAHGLRNPWRMSFDENGQLWAGDVGQNKLEEIDIITKGGNYGWRIKEGTSTYNTSGSTVNESELIAPVWEYDRSSGDVSITGGVVYRGSVYPALRGKYIYADYVTGRLWVLTMIDGKVTNNQEIATSVGAISAFGEDAKNELYLCDHGSGKILKLVAD